MNVTIKYIIQNNNTGISATQKEAGKLPVKSNKPGEINIDLPNASNLKEELLPILNNVAASYIKTKQIDITENDAMKDANQIVREFLNIDE